MEWKDLSILITGGTGSFGKKFIEKVLKNPPRRLIIFSRDEVKQLQIRQRYPDAKHSSLRYFIGDIRDRERLYRAFHEVDIVIHAAALKQVPTAEFNPLEVIKTNILGVANLIDAAIDCGVKKVIALSTDKAVQPINLYGATKLCADKLIVSAMNYAGPRNSKFCAVRYGNVMGSRGSVIPIFLEHRDSGVLPITDPRMTRFWITLDQAVDFVLRCTDLMRGGEIFIPKLKSMRLVDLAKALAPKCRHEIIGIRPGEKLHEVLITEDEARRTLEFPDFYVVQPGPLLPGWNHGYLMGGRLVSDNFMYSSEANDSWMTPKELLLSLEEDEEPTDAEVYPLRTAMA
jgi:UDP-N-acetylglucosamine 4,6-dehydratase